MGQHKKPKWKRGPSPRSLQPLEDAQVRYTIACQHRRAAAARLAEALGIYNGAVALVDVFGAEVMRLLRVGAKR